MHGERLSVAASTNEGPVLTIQISSILLRILITISYCVDVAFDMSPTHWKPRFNSDITHSTGLHQEWQGEVLAMQR